jgi:hypothetical protein
MSIGFWLRIEKFGSFSDLNGDRKFGPERWSRRRRGTLPAEAAMTDLPILPAPDFDDGGLSGGS